MNIAINGFGRIGRNFLRVLLEDATALKMVNIVAINIGSASPHLVGHSFKYDTLLGPYQSAVHVEKDTLIINDHRIKLINERDPLNLSWNELEVDWVIEATGKFTSKKEAEKHCTAGAKKVLISAPSEDADAIIIMGVNDGTYSKEKDTIVSAGSCTTNALAPVLKVLMDTCGIESAYMTTVHAYTNDQALLDKSHPKVRRGRAAALNIIPTSTGATKVVTMVLPELEGKIEGSALRVPVSKVSLIDLSFVAQKDISIELLNAALHKAEGGALKNILAFTDEPLVSTDFNLNNNSVIIDGLLTQAVGKLGKIFGWYDNEWAYSCRLKDFLVKYGSK